MMQRKMCPMYRIGLIENIERRLKCVNGSTKTRSIRPWSVRIESNPAIRNSIAMYAAMRANGLYSMRPKTPYSPETTSEPAESPM